MITRVAAIVGSYSIAIVVAVWIFGSSHAWAGVPIEPYGGPYLHFDSPRYWASQSDGTVPVKIKLSAPCDKTVTVAYQASDGTGSYAATCPTNYEMDYYVANSSNIYGTVTFSPYETCRTVYVTLNDNNLSDGSRNFTLSLSSPSNAALGYVRFARFTIIDDSITNQEGKGQVDVYAFEGWGGTWKISGAFLNDFFIEPLQKKPEKGKEKVFPNVTLHQAAQDEFTSAQNKIESTYKKDKTRRIVLLGYSAGGDAVTRVATHLDKNKIPVDLAFTLDPVAVYRGELSHIALSLNMDGFKGYTIPGIVEKWVSHYQNQDMETCRWLLKNKIAKHGIWGCPIPGVKNETQYKEKDFVAIRVKNPPNAKDAAKEGHIYMPKLSSTYGDWVNELGIIAGKGPR